MLRSWAFRVATVTAILLGLGAAAASACNEPNLVLGQSQAGAGDTVSYSISGTDQGASYTLSVDGVGAGSGTDDTLDPGTSGSFTMPDLGNTPRTAYVKLVTTHEGNGWTSEKSIQYAVPQSATIPSGSAKPPASSQAPAETPSKETHPRSESTDPRSESRSRDATPGYAPSAPNIAAVGSATIQTPETSAQDASEADAKAGNAGAAGVARRDDATVVRSRPLDVPAATAIPGYMLLALTLVLLAGVGVIGLLALRRRPFGDDAIPVVAGPWTPPPFRAEARMRAMLIEAELQEMIAEHRAAMMAGPSEEVEQLHR